MTKENEPISAIAIQVGFADQSHFTRAFKRVVGIAPGIGVKSRDDNHAKQAKGEFVGESHGFPFEPSLLIRGK
jgi:AraC-like DNA-binding protein